MEAVMPPLSSGPLASFSVYADASHAVDAYGPKWHKQSEMTSSSFLSNFYVELDGEDSKAHTTHNYTNLRDSVKENVYSDEGKGQGIQEYTTFVSPRDLAKSKDDETLRADYSGSDSDSDSDSESQPEVAKLVVCFVV